MAARAEFRNNPGQGNLLVARHGCYASLSATVKKIVRSSERGGPSLVSVSVCLLAGFGLKLS
jgi:hypothetical protein